jgi:hypothetical protein
MYLSKEDELLMDEFRKIARREGKSMAQMIKEFMIEYVKAHGQGNFNYTLDPWRDKSAFKAYPALDSDWEKADLSAFDNKDLQHISQKAREILHFAEIEAKKRDLTV